MNKIFILLSAINLLLLQPLSGQSSSSATDSFFIKLVDAAIERTKHKVIYDPAYYSIEYPNGDIPDNKGVCTDLIIRAYRKAGIDLQKEVHEDMARNFDKYPKIWGLSYTDKNIDHRRVPNLATYFTRQGAKLPVSNNAADYKPGDLVTWDLGGGIAHIGLVTFTKSRGNQRYLIVHNIGAGPEIEDMLFDYKITGHYRYKK
ncbi:MAG: DUF1287 domain-containing protein [Bacteroidales bacterium]|nr:DUF1287 domain-containing protein [Bacteroidales bacterium]